MSELYIEIAIRSSRSQMFFKVGVPKNVTIFTGKHLRWRPATLLKRVSNTGVFLCWKYLFHRKPPVAASEQCKENWLEGVTTPKRKKQHFFNFPQLVAALDIYI